MKIKEIIHYLNNNSLKSIALFCGIIPFIVGWTVFLTWLIARHWFAINIEELEGIGFLWILICFIVAIGGLFLLLFHLKELKKVIISSLFIFVNVPSVYFIMMIHSKNAEKTFVKIKNESETKYSSILLSGTKSTWKLNELNNSKVFNFQYDYWINDARNYQKSDTLKLILKSKTSIDTIDFPQLEMSKCYHLTLDKNLKISID